MSSVPAGRSGAVLGTPRFRRRARGARTPIRSPIRKSGTNLPSGARPRWGTADGGEDVPKSCPASSGMCLKTLLSTALYVIVWRLVHGRPRSVGGQADLVMRGRGRRHGVVSTSLNVEDQHRLVEAILRIDAMSVRRERAVHLAALERDLGHRLHYAQHDREMLDVWALVDALLNYPGAAQALVRILQTFYPNSLSVRALDELVSELLPEPWLDQADRRELHELITWLERVDPGLTHLGRFPMLYRRAVGPAWPALDREIRSMHDVVALLEEMPAGPEGTPPLLVFVSDLAEEAGHPTAPALRDWVRRQAETQGLDRA